MLVFLILAHSLQWLACLSSNLPDYDHSIKRPSYSPPNIHRSHLENVNFVRIKTLNSSRRRSMDNGEKAREIVEIVSADPTTQSTLITPNYPIDCTNEKECDLITSMAGQETTPLPTFKPYSQEELNFYLKNYVNTNGKLPDESIVSGSKPTNKLANLYMDEPVNILEGSQAKDEGKSQQTSKSWQLMQGQSHKHPYDDRTGWVSLEPVAWSASQVQKWEPNNRPQHPPHWAETNDQHHHSSWNNRPPSSWQDNKPWNKKPTYEYKPSSKPPWNDYSSSNHWSGNNPDIITDSSPSHFPQYESTKKPSWQDRPQTGYNSDNFYHNSHNNHPPTHPSEGDGHWVLLSSTKGYSVPQRSRNYQRSLFINAKTPPDQKNPPSVKSHRSVRLTVLPALNGTTNTTTSHGGLLEVEQTFQTVDEAQREHAAKMMRLENINQGKSNSPVANKRSATTVRIYPVKAPNLEANSKAMLAAVGAGMIPATMAMIVPMVMGRKRRSLPEEQHIYFYDPHRIALM
ncbi:hypothetical protein O3M35_000313 [Rhynocoris fuscipes]|uniref:Uncharacterized protein n=1 Tax=Rhynocoris fuscipes TaxID=488301 RepID=A0AAW1DPQ9_9HEMI